MKKVIILTILASIFLTFFIYKITYNDEIVLVALGDGISLGLTAYNVKGYSYNDYLKDYFEDNNVLDDYIDEFASVDETSKSLVSKIVNNDVVGNLAIQQVISKASVITISVGMDELNNIKVLKSKDYDNYINNMEKIMRFIKNVNHNKVVITGLYESNKLSKEVVEKVNKRLKVLVDNYGFEFVDISEVINNKDYYLLKNSYYLNYKGHQYIYELVKEVV